MAASDYQRDGVLTKSQFLRFFNRFSVLISRPEIKKNMASAVKKGEDAHSSINLILEGVFMEIGVEPKFGTSCLHQINTTYGSDRNLMVQFYKFAAAAEMACDEAVLGPEKFAKKLQEQSKQRKQQLDMLIHMRKFNLTDQSAVLEKLHQKLKNANFEHENSVLTLDQIEEMARRKTPRDKF